LPQKNKTFIFRLSTIVEENSNPQSIREVSVRLSRLDADTVKSHLSKQNNHSDLPQQDTTTAKETGSILSNNSSLNVDVLYCVVFYSFYIFLNSRIL
jgi:hypothetical protein